MRERPAGRSMRGLPARSEGGAPQVQIGEVVLGLVRAGGGHGDLDPAHAEPDQGADLQQLQADGAAGGVANWVWRRPMAQRVEQDVGERGEP